MKHFFIFLILFFGLFVVSCNSSKEEADVLLTLDEDLDLPRLDIQFPVLLPEAQDKITSWQYFKEFENDLLRINKGNVRSYRAETERMAIVTDSLLKNIPEGLNTNAISSRMRVVNVRVKLLDETMHQVNVKTEVISDNLIETNIAFTNLINQINEKFEKQRIDALTRTQDNIDNAEGLKTRDSL
jgi:hypothetical protein